MENVLRHPVFLNGAATTGFIETYSKDLFKFEGHSNIRANKLLMYLADMVSTLNPGGRGGGRIWGGEGRRTVPAFEQVFGA
jgi:pyruvate carboxylase